MTIRARVLSALEYIDIGYSFRVQYVLGGVLLR